MKSRKSAVVALLLAVAAGPIQAQAGIVERGRIYHIDWSVAEFGNAVAIAGNTVIVGTAGSQKAFVLSRTGTAWSSFDIGNGAGDFGNAVAISEDESTVVIGARLAVNNGYSGAGLAFVYIRSGGSWALQKPIIPTDESLSVEFGTSVAISGDTLVVGAPKFDLPNREDTGQVYVYTRLGSDWSLQAKIVAPDGAAGDRFGSSVAITGNSIAIGAHSKDHSTRGADTGAVYVVERTGTVWGTPLNLVPLVADLAAGDELGSSVTLAGSRIVAGASKSGPTNRGAAYAFVRAASSWSFERKLGAANPEGVEEFGASVAIAPNGGRVIVGAPWNDSAGIPNSGNAYLYDTGTWSETVLRSSSEEATDIFGNSVALSNTTVIVGSPRDDAHHPDSGSVFVFDLDDTAPVSAIDPPGPAVVAIPSQTLTGHSSDGELGSGVDTVTVRYTWAAGFFEASAKLSCNSSRTECDWSVPAPSFPGIYTMTVRARDRCGNEETPVSSVQLLVV